MFRNQADFTRAFNCFALAALDTESRPLAEAELTSHVHFCSQCDSPKEFMRQYRYSYTRFFNSKYKRKGRLGEKYYYITEIDGIRHLTCGVNYVLRQGLHHGITSTAFEYQNCSVNSIFRKELGKDFLPNLISDSTRYLYLPEGVSDPRQIRMNKDGLLLREDVLDIGYLEEVYITPRNFLFQMNRLSDESWISEQKEENEKSPIITLDSIEKGMSDTEIQLMKQYEKGRVNKSQLTDIELCELIDNYYLNRYFNKIDSIYELKESSKSSLAERIWKDLTKGSRQKISEKQLRRCLALPRNG